MGSAKPDTYKDEHSFPGHAGVTLAELLITLAILSVGVLAFVGAFMNLSKSIHVSKAGAIANSLMQEKIESLKDVSYYRLIPTTAPLTAAAAVGSFSYDGGFYPEEQLVVGGISFTRRTYVDKCQIGVSGPEHVSYLNEDTGLKRIRVYVVWQEAAGWKVTQMQNLVANPSMRKQSGTVSGNVDNTSGSNLSGALVTVLENSAYFDQTDSAGDYSFTIVPGSYTLRASMRGYFPLMQDFFVGENATYTWNPDLTAMSSGTVTGTAYIRDHLVISRVVGSTVNASTGFDQEYVEVYNPTTWTWTMANTIGLKIRARNTDPESDVDVNYLNSDIQPAGFYLFANVATISAGGEMVAADAVWEQVDEGPNDLDAGLPCFEPASSDINVIPTYDDFQPPKSKALCGSGQGLGSVKLVVTATGEVLDKFGWKGGGGSGTSPTDYEAAPYDHGQTAGLNDNEHFRRYSSSTGYTATLAPAYDAGNNDTDWSMSTSGDAPRCTVTSTAAIALQSGTPAASAYVSADDGLSGPVQCDSVGYFRLTSVATGTWNVSLASGEHYLEVSTTVSTNGATYSIGGVGLTSSTTNGFVTGTVYRADNNTALSGITVQGMGVVQAVTDASGKYKLTGSTGTSTITANPGNADQSFVSMSSDSVNVLTGQYTTGIDFYLSSGGRIHGQILISNNAVPGVPVVASTTTGVTSGEAVTDANGIFTITNLSTGSYTITPQLELGETYTPTAPTVSITSPAQDVFAATFTIANALGSIEGNLTNSGENILTGVLLVASTTTISGSNPPDITAAVRSGTTKYYSASSQADGTYSISVPGGNAGTPITYNVYAWYVSAIGGTASKKSGTAAVTGGLATTGVNFSWP